MMSVGPSGSGMPVVCGSVIFVSPHSGGAPAASKYLEDSGSTYRHRAFEWMLNLKPSVTGRERRPTWFDVASSRNCFGEPERRRSFVSKEVARWSEFW